MQPLEFETRSEPLANFSLKDPDMGLCSSDFFWIFLIGDTAPRLQNEGDDFYAHQTLFQRLECLFSIYLQL